MAGSCIGHHRYVFLNSSLLSITKPQYEWFTPSETSDTHCGSYAAFPAWPITAAVQRTIIPHTKRLWQVQNPQRIGSGLIMYS